MTSKIIQKDHWTLNLFEGGETVGWTEQHIYHRFDKMPAETRVYLEKINPKSSKAMYEKGYRYRILANFSLRRYMRNENLELNEKYACYCQENDQLFFNEIEYACEILEIVKSIIETNKPLWFRRNID